MKTLCWVGMAFAVAVSASAGEIWIAPNGSDAAAGSREAPLATVHAALRKGREWRRLKSPEVADGVTIRLRGGDYPLHEAIIVRPEDSGTPASPTTITAAPGEQPIVTGGVKVVGWRRLAEAPARLPAVARGQVWAAPLPTFNGRTLEFRQLWVDGSKAVRARTPNGDAMERLVTWDRAARVAGIPAAVAVPQDLTGVEMTLLQAWEIAVLRLKSHRADGEVARVQFHEPESRIQFEHPWPPPPMPGKDGKNAPFFLANALEFLDEPGEWFADVRAGVVYYWPRPDQDLAHAVVVAPAVEQLVRIAGTYDRPVQHVSFEGIAFAHTTWMRPSLLGHVPHQAGFPMLDAYSLKPPGTPEWRSLDNQALIARPPAAMSLFAARHVRVVGCRFTAIAANALDAHLGVQDAVFEGNVFRDIGINAVVAGAFGEEGFEIHLPWEPSDERSFTARLRIANNVITQCATEDWGGIPIIAGFVRDTAIEHNDIYETGYTGISVGWGWTRTASMMRNNRVHANRLERVALRTADNAGIYTQSNQPGTVVSENAVFPITMSPWVHDADHWFYLYTDEGSSYMAVRDNWVPAEKFLENAIGPGNIWKNNGPHVDEKIKRAAGLEPAWRERLAADLVR